MRPELVVWNGTPSPLGISTPNPYGKDFEFQSLATSSVSNEMGGMQAPNVTEAARD
ncbi:MAG: hypothetical protein ACRC80_30785 [Waterburya sp.]